MTKEASTEKKTVLRPPIVAVLGHVDHGKTTLLDTIRKSQIAEGEAGGITQHIGAYQISVPEKDFKIPNAQTKITFIDTPGHEAFSKMRSRGSTLADFAILVVAATEGVKPQTQESIAHIKKANIPVIVALTKMDLPEANVDKVKQQLAKENILVEQFGGTVVAIPVSAKAGTGIKELLETILLLSAMQEISADPKADMEAVVIESKLDKHRGPLASVIVTKGVLKTGVTIYAEKVEARVRAMMDSSGKQVSVANPSDPVEIMGWKSVPEVGATVTLHAPDTHVAAAGVTSKPFSLPPLTTVNKLKMVLKADTVGTLEAIKENLNKEQIEIVASGVGDVSESDILMAKTSGAVVIGFSVAKPNHKVELLAREEKVRTKIYSIIYELLEEIHEVTQLMNKPEAAETVVGTAIIQATFDIDGVKIAGCRLESGKFAKTDLAKIMRAEKEVGRGRMKSIRQGKADVPSVVAPMECGVVFDKKLDFAKGDRIIAITLADLLA